MRSLEFTFVKVRKGEGGGSLLEAERVQEEGASWRLERVQGEGGTLLEVGEGSRGGRDLDRRTRLYPLKEEKDKKKESMRRSS